MRISRITAVQAWALVAAGCLALQASAARGQGRAPGRPIEFSDVKQSEVATNLNQLNSKKDRLSQLEDDFGRSFNSALGAESSVVGVAPSNYHPPPKPRVLSKRAKKELQERTEWEYLDPKDMASGSTPDDVLKTPEYDELGMEKTEKTPLEKFYDRLDESAKGGKNGNGSKDGSNDSRKSGESPDASDKTDDPDLPGTLGDAIHSLRRGLDADSFTDGRSTPGHNSFSDFFGINAASPSLDQAPKSRVEDYQKFYNPAPESSGGSLSGASPAFSAPFSSSSAFSSGSSFSSSSLGGSSLGGSSSSPSGGGSFSSGFSSSFSGLPQDSGARSFDTYSTPPPPQPAAPKFAPLPTFNAPLRQGL